MSKTNSIMKTYDIQFSKFINGAPAKVYAAWTDVDLVRKWYCAQGLNPGPVALDVRVGGSYSATLGILHETFTSSGVYREVVPNEKLVFTNGWDDPNRVETVVTVEFRKKGQGTEVLITQERFISEDEAEGHKEGWLRSLENLAKAFEK